MASEAKRVQPGIYIVFLGEAVTYTDLDIVMRRVHKAAEVDEQANDYIIVVDAIEILNPLKIARLMPKLHHEGVSRYIFTANTVTGQVLAGRAAEMLPVTVEVSDHQKKAVERAKTIRGTLEEPDLLSCDYLPD